MRGKQYFLFFSSHMRFIMTKKKLITLCTIIFLALLFIFPKISFESAKNGLLLWFNTVVPTLLPFLILSNFMIFFKITPYVSQIFSPILCPLLRISKNACYPVVLGILSGYPLGAKTCNDFVDEHLISKEEGNNLILLCNNASPMFLTYYVSCYCLNAENKQYIYYCIIILSSFITFTIFRLFSPSSSNPKTFQEAPVDFQNTETNFLPFLDKAIINSAVILVKVGGYIILFSILAKQIISIPYLPLHIKSFVSAIFELTIGTHSLSTLPVLSYQTKTALILSLSSFGGLSALLQTKSVISSSRLSIKRYFFSKCISALITYLFVHFFFLLHII